MGFDVLFTWLIQNIETIIPFTVVRTGYQGVLYTAGVAWVTVPPGIWFRIPYLEEITPKDTREQPMNLPSQTITTRDGLPFTFSVNIRYQVTDPLQMVWNVSDLDSVLESEAMIHMGKKVPEQTLAEVMEQRPKYMRSLKETLTTRVKDWGVKINDVGFTDQVSAPAVRLFNVNEGN